MSVPVSVSGPDIETLLAAHVYGVGPVLGGHPMICSCGAVSTSGGDEPLQTAHRAHVAVVLRAHIVTWLTDEAAGELEAAIWASRLDLSHRPVQWRDEDNGYNAGLDHAAGKVRLVLAALVGQIGVDHD